MPGPFTLWKMGQAIPSMTASPGTTIMTVCGGDRTKFLLWDFPPQCLVLPRKQFPEYSPRLLSDRSQDIPPFSHLSEGRKSHSKPVPLVISLLKCVLLIFLYFSGEFGLRLQKLLFSLVFSANYAIVTQCLLLERMDTCNLLFVVSAFYNLSQTGDRKNSN